ncbi:hypothetical protein F2Q69_00034979 [Brassica cretica]|uniref:Kinesin motor domain-containing protein n=1 Tax=Brassica cretica TaxID=69181 RepID=A0A8S9SP23_BRACR|nr:hypothetical protein F2Q69_00034979 [Brassica cretica]
MDQGAAATLAENPSEGEFCLSLRNGLILCNVLNKVNPGSVLKVVENPVTLAIQYAEGAAQSAIQYFENMRNFLKAVEDMQLLTFGASDLEKGGSSNKVVDCILCLKGFYEWKQAGGVGVWRYGGTVRIVSLHPKVSSASLSLGSESNTDESVSLDESESSQHDQLLDFLHLSNDIATEESETAISLAFLFDHFALQLLNAYLKESDGINDLPLNEMVIDTLLNRVVKDFSAILVSQGTQLGSFLRKILKCDNGNLSRTEFLEAVFRYLRHRKDLVSKEFSKFCTCGGKPEIIGSSVQEFSPSHAEAIGLQQKELEDVKSNYMETRCQVEQMQSEWHEELQRIVHHVKAIEVTSSSYHKVLEENRLLYNEVQDLKEQIYIDTQPVIRSVLDGFNVCIFAYGQTGSGKTYTMSGPDLMTETTWGVNYRALRDLFQLSNARTHVVAYEIGVQMIEIYNEQVRDLLFLTLDIRNNSQLNGLNVPDASLVPVSSTRDVLDLMRIGQKNRAVGATALNERSSRSHSVLTVHVQGKELATGSILRGCLHLVDLAGSERVEKSEAVGERLKEAQHINKSLSALGDVISALAQKSSHVPYRNSKLTQVLQDSLGGQAKTLMFVHINPEVNAVGETISTLKFAQRVSSIELGAARSNKETGEIRDLKDEISSLKSALEKKQAELEQVRAGGIRATTECQKSRTVSPFHIPRTKADASPQPSESMRNYETRSCSTGKQRKAGFTSAIRNREASPKMPNLAEERLDPRSPSPTSRRSLSTDRGSSIKSRNKPEVTQNLPVSRTPFPARVPVAKSFATVPLNPSGENRLRIDNTSETLHSHQKLSTRKLFPEVDEQHMRHALNIRQGGVKKTKAESIKAKGKQPSPARFQKFDVGISLRSEADSQVKTGSYLGNNPNVMHSRFQNFDVGISLCSDLCAGDKSDSTTLKTDSSETDNEHVLFEPPLRLKNVQRNFIRNSQNHKLRTIYAHEDPSLVNKLDDKPSKGNSNISLPEFRRSRSTNHGRFP